MGKKLFIKSAYQDTRKVTLMMESANPAELWKKAFAKSLAKPCLHRDFCSRSAKFF